MLLRVASALPLLTVEGPRHGLSAAAQEAARRFQFRPARVNGEAVAVRIRYAYTFTLPTPSQVIAPEAESVSSAEPSEAVGESHRARSMPAEPPSGEKPPSLAMVEAEGLGPASEVEDEVVVLAYSVANELERSSAAVTVVELAGAQREAADMGEVLARTEGVNVQRNGGLGSPERFSLAGYDDTQVRFFIDGLPLRFQGFSQGLQNVPLGVAGRIEVYKGVVPIALGADTLGGAFNLVTDRETVGTQARASCQGGAFDTHRLAAAVRHREDTTGLFVKGEGYLGSTSNSFPVDVVYGDRTGAETEARVRGNHDSYRAGGGNLEVGVVDWRWARRLLLKVFANTYDKEIQHNNDMTILAGDGSGRDRSVSVDAQNVTNEAVYDFFGVQRPGGALYFKAGFGT